MLPHKNYYKRCPLQRNQLKSARLADVYQVQVSFFFPLSMDDPCSDRQCKICTQTGAKGTWMLNPHHIRTVTIPIKKIKNEADIA